MGFVVLLVHSEEIMNIENEREEPEMKMCITSYGPTLDSMIQPNPFVIAEEVKTVLTGKVGTRARLPPV